MKYVSFIEYNKHIPMYYNDTLLYFTFNINYILSAYYNVE